jgi:uncharacterized protein with GYD domain
VCSSAPPQQLPERNRNPQDRLELVGKQLVDAVGAHIVGGGYSFGEYDISIIVDAADDVTMAAVALAIAAGGAVKAAKTTSLLSGPQWVDALKKGRPSAPSTSPPSRKGSARRRHALECAGMR